MEPIGEPLVRFQSRSEFLQVMIEVVEGELFSYFMFIGYSDAKILTVLGYLKQMSAYSIVISALIISS